MFERRNASAGADLKPLEQGTGQSLGSRFEMTSVNEAQGHKQLLHIQEHRMSLDHMCYEDVR